MDSSLCCFVKKRCADDDARTWTMYDFSVQVMSDDVVLMMCKEVERTAGERDVERFPRHGRATDKPKTPYFTPCMFLLRGSKGGIESRWSLSNGNFCLCQNLPLTSQIWTTLPLTFLWIFHKM